MRTENQTDHLQRGVSAYLGDEERPQWQLTNRQTGVVRERDGDQRPIEPATDHGAVAVVTDRRVLFLIGGTATGRDDATSIPHGEIAGVDSNVDLLASQLVLTTGEGATWRFTVRETDELANAVAYLDGEIAGSTHVESTLELAREHRNAAATADEIGTATRQYDEAIAAYRSAVDLQTAPAVDAGVESASLRSEILATVETTIGCHLDRAREKRSRGNWEFQSGDETAAYRHLSKSLEAFDRALELAETCPPGDPDAIQAERDDLVSKLDELDIRTPVAEAGDE